MTGYPAPLLDSPELPRYGFPEYRKGEQPAAGAHFTQELGGHDFTRLVSVFVRLVTDATVSNRELVIEYRDDSDNRYALAGTAQVQAASLTRDYFFSGFNPAVIQPVDGTLIAPLAPLLLPPTHDFRIFTVNLQAGDQLSRVRFVWERFFTDVAPPGAGG